MHSRFNRPEQIYPEGNTFSMETKGESEMSGKQLDQGKISIVENA